MKPKKIVDPAPARGVFAAALSGALWLAAGAFCGAGEAPAPERPVHRFLLTELSPDAAFVASVEGDAPPSGYLPPIRQLVIRRVADGLATAVELPCGRVPECWPGSLSWSPDGSRLAFTLRVPGSHARSVYAVAADGSAMTRLLQFNGTIEALRYGPDGRLAMLATENAVKEVGATEAGVPISGDLDAAPPEQRIAILEGGTLHWASPPDLYVYEYDWRPARAGFVGTAAPGNGDDNWWTARMYAFSEGDTAPQLLYRPANIRQQIAKPKVARDGRSVVFIAGIMSDFGSTGGDVYRIPIEGGPAANLSASLNASASTLTWDCKGQLLVQLLKGDQTELVELGDTQQPASATVLWSGPETLGTRGGGVSAACPSGLTAVPHESFTEPPEIEFGPIGHWRNLTDANTGLSSPVRVQSLWWKSGGFDVQGWLLLPARANGKMPMITMIHGGPAAAVTPTFGGPGLVTTLLESGYALFRPNPRGSYGQGEPFTLANVRDLGHGDLRDVLAGIDAALRQAPIDEARLGIMGGSYGGFMAMWAVTQTTRFKAAVASAGVSDWLSYYGENGIDAWLIPYFGASVYDDPAVYARSSPINFIRKVRTPTFSYVGERDIECPAPQTQEFWHALKELGVPTAVMIYPGEGHGLRDPDHIADAMQRTLAWFDKYLK